MIQVERQPMALICCISEERLKDSQALQLSSKVDSGA